MVSLPGSQRFPRQRRLKSSGDFARVRQRKAYASDEVLVINAARSSRGATRLGLAVSRAVGNAVVRNRWKRLIREAFRRIYDQLPAGLDLVVRPRHGAVPEQAAISGSLKRLSSQLARRLARDNS